MASSIAAIITTSGRSVRKLFSRKNSGIARISTKIPNRGMSSGMSAVISPVTPF